MTILRMRRGRTYRYLQLDVFTDRVLEGNQLAVFPDAEELDPELMQSIALEMAFSETTFVFPAEAPQTDFRVRIFTPRSEIPMAGHPTIGTTFALAHEKRISKKVSSITFGLGIGPTPVALEWNSGTLHFAWMTQRLPEFGPELEHFDLMAAALGVDESSIRNTNLPIQVVSCGLPFLFVPLASRDAVNACELERSALLRFCSAARIDELGVFVFSLEDAADQATAFSRMFAPGFGIAEDPATGGASGPLGCFLVHHNAVSATQAKHLVSLQGVKLRRPSRIHISIRANDGRIEAVRVGGQAALIGEGTLNIR
jgi:trans-2,3-dihydro-3-hydroxyanthranilate isomerase